MRAAAGSRDVFGHPIASPGRVVVEHAGWRLVYLADTLGRHEFFAERAQDLHKVQLGGISLAAAKERLFSLAGADGAAPCA